MTVFYGRRTGGKYLKCAVEENRVHSIFLRAESHRFRQGHRACGLPRPGRQFANRSKFLAVAQPKIAHVTVESVDLDGLSAGRLRPFRRTEGRFRTLAAQRAYHVE